MDLNKLTINTNYIKYYYFVFSSLKCPSASNTAVAPALFPIFRISASTHSDDTPFLGNKVLLGDTENTCGEFGKCVAMSGECFALRRASSSGIPAPSLANPRIASCVRHASRMCSGESNAPLTNLYTSVPKVLEK